MLRTPRTAHPTATRARPARTLGLAALALAVAAVPALVGASAGAAPAPVSAGGAVAPRADVGPVHLYAPRRLETTSYDGRAYTDLGLRIVADGEAFELWSTRAAYDQKIRTVWRSGAGDVALPMGSMTRFGTLRNFLEVTIRPVKGGAPTRLVQGTCLAGWAERVTPEAPAVSPYSRYCAYNPYALGAVQGIQAGWATPALTSYRPLRLTPGRYQVTSAIAKRYADRLGLSAAEAHATTTLVVRAEAVDGGPTPEPGHVGRVARPAAHEPSAVSGGRVPATVPDLRSLPAWGIQVSENDRFLQFSATVWNAGTSPLVVDGFRREGEDEMDAYQYFFDSEGEQTGYQRVGGFHWDAKPTHQHWHFRDFATYTLLKADRTAVVRSRKEAFCLANTDAVDTTVPSAAWNPDNTDLSTACGDYSSLSIREVLASGWGDTYAQFRAGQSFDLEGLPNGTYFIEVKANPRGRLVEASTSNNVALRRIVLGGTPGKRTVKVPKVGLVVEPSGPSEGGF